MSKVVGILNDRKIHEDDPNLVELVRRADYWAVSDYWGSGWSETRCDYCGRKVSGWEDCKSCGAPLK